MRILRIEPWAIKFEHKGQKYLLHQSESDYESSVQLYRFDADEFGRYELTYLTGKLGRLSLAYDKRHKHGETYRDTTKSFISQLVKDGFAAYIDGLDPQEAEMALKMTHLDELRKRRAELSKQYAQVSSEIATLMLDIIFDSDGKVKTDITKIIS